MPRPGVTVWLLPLLVVGACAGGSARVEEPVPTLFDDSTSTVTTEPEETAPPTPSTSTIPVAERLPALVDDIPGTVLTDDTAVLPITGTDGDVWFVLGPCGEDQIQPAATATLIPPQHVVLDPGGSLDAAGEANLAVARRTAELLRSEGVAVLLTREGDVEVGTATRGAAAPAVGAHVLVSIHRAEGEGTTDDPRPTVFHRADDAESRRLGGLIHQAVTAAFEGVDGEFGAQVEPGVRPLLNQRGEDYFRVLETSRDVAAARVEMPVVPVDASALLSQEEGRDIEAHALADGIVRFLVTREEGDGFVDPFEVVRVAPTSNTPGGC